MYKRIVVAVDGSRAAALGLKEAVALAKDQKARLLLVHVVDEHLLVPALDAFAGAAAAIEAMRASGHKIVEKAREYARGQGVTCDSAVLETLAAPAADVIVKQARKWRADLLVLGTHGRRGLRRLVLGSDAEQVVRNSPVPVLLVRNPNPARAARRARR